MAAYYVKTLSDNLGYVTWIYYPAMGTLNCNSMFNNVLSIISVYGIRDCCNQIKYDYGRLVGISYLDHSENDMKYHYGATYDSWNRVRTMTYPDGEVVTYAYNAAGQIASVKSNKQGKEETIVEKVGYDKDGHTVYTKLGNGTETTYTYDKRRERLQEMNLTAAGTSIMYNKYQYDAVDNILGITNAVDPTRGTTNGDKKLGGAFKHSYAYDDLNRLVYASGKAKQASYSMQMTFGRMSEPLTKIQKVDSTKTAQSYDFTYKYEDSNHPTAPTQIGHEHYTYDANGNPTLVENDSLGTERRMFWDEDNRLMVLSDNGKTSRYTYNAAGERIIKSHGDLEGVYINGAPQGIALWLSPTSGYASAKQASLRCIRLALKFHETEDYTIYPAPIITVTKNRFTKHYFIGDKRIASKIGTGKFSNVYGISGNHVTAGQKDYAARMMQIEKQREEYYKSRETPPGVPTMKGATADPDNTHRGYNDIIGDLGDHSVPEGWVQRPKFNEKGDVPGPPIQWQKPEDPDNVQPGYGYIPTDTTNTEDIFFYHSDHLGSTSYITDAKANITQFDAYLPYGELLVDEHSSSKDMPYKFNGKELDQETGLYYYGARYMNPVTSLWYGVDPLAGKYANNSPYVYCNDNPIRLIDPNGKALGDFFLSIEKSAVDFGLFYNDNSIREDIEYGSSIYQVRNSNGQLGYTYTIAERGSKHGVTPSCPNLFRKVVADIHTHGAWSNGEYKDNEFSGIRDKKGNLLTSDKLQKVDTQNGDIGDSNRTQLTSFLVTPNGSLQSYDPKIGKIKVLSNNMPSDYRDPDRMNSVSSYIEKHPVSIMKEASQKLKESINIIDR